MSPRRPLQRLFSLRPRMSGWPAAAATLIVVAALVGACDAAEGVDVEPLPPLERPTPEVRAGVPEVAGTWRFAGWEVASLVVAEEIGEPAHPGDLVLQTQRIDSLAGFLARGDERIPLIGEVRRDGVVSLITPDTDGAARFAAGRLSGDTLWLELATLPYGTVSPPTTRWAFVRSTVGQPTLRLPSGALLRDTLVTALPPDTVAARPAEPPPTQPTTPEQPARQPPTVRPEPQRPPPAAPAAPPRVEEPPAEPQEPPAQEPPAQEPQPDDTVQGPQPPGELHVEPPR